ncbi:MAG TPA: molybdenum cofactor biosynthesis protein MoaE [Pirellulales bacterium]|nr:molybdenum cofactor biosynthesis protein MoaE [Pirellulales bacterium]
MVELTEQPIDTTAVIGRVSSPLAGALVLFLGTTRQWTGSRQTESLDYECYPEMARAKLAELEGEARRRWPLVECMIVHRLGRLELGEASVAVAVSSAHRQAAFEAGQWLIDTLKQVAPIWKKENWSDGATEWVHPGLKTETDSLGNGLRAIP